MVADMEINDGHYLELMDRLSIVMANLDNHCIEHPLAKKEEEISSKLEEAISNIYEAYQLIESISPNIKNNSYE